MREVSQTELTPSRASPLPHSTAVQGCTRSKCGSGLAREEALEVTRNAGSTPDNRSPNDKAWSTAYPAG
ncbi:MAG TPA: hypothetical protein DIW86_12605 [Pseudomonas sp.]|nr:hypothetical protein [Pseudomonas sp.]